LILVRSSTFRYWPEVQDANRPESVDAVNPESELESVCEV